MNKRESDPENKDFTEKRNKAPWCVEHHEQLKDVWVALRGNGKPEHGLMWKVAKIEDRQCEILDFVKSIKSVFWKSLPVAMGGAVSAFLLLVWQIVKLLIEHGKM